MKIHNQILNASIVPLEQEEFLEKQRIAGKVVSGCLALLEKEVLKGTTKTLLELNALAEEFIYDNKCLPTFKNYLEFPVGCCISVNRQLVHGIPTNQVLKDGDLVTFDLGATFDYAIGDAARTFIYGTSKFKRHEELIKVTKECFDLAVKAIKIDSKIGVIGNAIYNHASKNGFGVISDFGGHRIGRRKDNNGWNGVPHCYPFISNKSSPSEGITIQPGLTIAIEPLLCIGLPKTTKLDDGWTIVTPDINCHYEDTIFIHEDKIENLTNEN